MIISIPNARAALNFPPSRDAEVVALIEAAEADWKDLTGWALATDEEVTDFTMKRTEYLTEPDTRRLYLPGRLIDSFEIIGWDSGDTPPDYGDTDLVAETDYRADLALGVLMILTPSVRDYYRTRISGGYTEDTMPAQIKQAIILQARYRNAREAAALLVSKATGGDGRSQQLRNEAYHPTMMAVTDKYRRWGY